MITEIMIHEHQHESQRQAPIHRGLSKATLTALELKKEREDDALAKAAYTVIDFIKVVGYYVVGCVVLYYSEEEMGVRESIYFLTVTLTTIGYGDVVPKSELARIFMMFWIVVGLGGVFPVIIKAADHVMRRMETVAMKFVDEDPDDDYDPLWVKGVLALVMIFIPLAIGNIYFLLIDQCDPPWTETDAVWMTFVTMTTVGYCVKIKFQAPHAIDAMVSSQLHLLDGVEVHKGLRNSSQDNLTHWLISTQVGYGDLALCNKEQDMIFLACFAIFSVVLVAGAIGTLGNLYNENDRQTREAKLLASFDIDMIKALDTDGDGVDKNEYVLGMLSALGHLDGDAVARYEKQFLTYDVDKSGRLTQADLDQINGDIQQKVAGSPVRRRRPSADASAEAKSEEERPPPRAPSARRVNFSGTAAPAPRYAEC